MQGMLKERANAFGSANKFLGEIGNHPELVRKLRTEVLTMVELIELGEEMGLTFDGEALQSAFRGHFLLRMAAAQRSAEQ